jgi:predicted ATPase/DNA-binding NarL/FixJ family response regulator
VTSFVGREREVAEVKRCLSAGRLVTLTGPGGVGKTRLAVRVAAERRRAFRGGVWLVDLTDLRDPQLLARMIAAAVGLREQPGRPPLTTLVDWLGAERVLLILDNCEHLLDACADITTGLLRACPGLQILATSREPLNVAGEMTLTVPPLSLPDLGALPPAAALTRYGAVSLFVDRAVAAAPGFRLTEENRATVAKIAHRLDGLPLAIELAAVRLRVLTAEQLLERLADRYRVLAPALRGGPEHQLALRASIDWSFRLCTAQEQRLWARLAVFSGGFELDAIEAICSDEAVATEAVLDLVAGLIDKSILICEEYRFGLRYRMLESFREYAVEKLAEHQETAVLARRHRDWHEQLVQRVNAEWISPRQEYWLERLPREHPNLRAALDDCRTAPDGAEAALRILIAIPPAYLWARDLLGETRRWLDQTLPRSTEPSPLRARALLLAAQLAIAQGDLDAAQGSLAEGRELAQQLADPAALALAGYASANTAMYTGDLTAALRFFAEALTASASLPTVNQRLDVLLALAIAAGLAEDQEQVVACHEQIVALTEPIGERFNRSNSLWALGLAASRQGDHSRAAQLQQRALRLKWEIDDRLGAALSMEALAQAAVEDPERAAILLGVAETLWLAGGTQREAQAHLVGYHDECVQRTRRALGAAAYEKIFRRGLGLPADEGVAFALGVISPAREPDRAPVPPPDATGPTTLTPRERQVAELIGQGLSNKDIAGALVIAQRTAEGHVENILAKLGFKSRSQVASWVAQQRTGKAARP